MNFFELVSYISNLNRFIKRKNNSYHIGINPLKTLSKEKLEFLKLMKISEHVIFNWKYCWWLFMFSREIIQKIIFLLLSAQLNLSFGRFCCWVWSGASFYCLSFLRNFKWEWRVVFRPLYWYWEDSFEVFPGIRYFGSVAVYLLLLWETHYRQHNIPWK